MNIQSTSAMQRFATATAAVTFVAGALLCWLLPERAWAHGSAALAIPVVWLLMRTFSDSAKFAQLSKRLAPALAGAGLILSVSMLAVIAQELALIQAEPGELSKRAWGLIMCALVAVYANAVPKQAASPNKAKVLRFSAWSLVLGGLGYALAWVLAPLAYANFVAIGILGTAVALVVARTAWCYRKRSSSPPAVSG